MIQENPKQKEGNVIWAPCQRTRIKTKGSNLDAILENLKEREGIESVRDAGEPETKGRDRI